MSKRSPELLLEDMIEAAKKVLSYAQGLSFDEFVQDNKTLDAVTRNFEIIGEAAKEKSRRRFLFEPAVTGQRLCQLSFVLETLAFENKG